MSDRKNIIIQNRKARYDYEILDTYEAGIELQGTEVKSLRQGNANLKDGHARPENGELFLYNLHIDEYTQANQFNHNPVRKRRLLLHKHEINRLGSRVAERGVTLIPLKLYFKRGKVKIQLAMARGKRAYDRRKAISRRDTQREMEKTLKERIQIRR